MSIATNFPSINPSLLLDFANSRVLDPRITFTRASTATYFDRLGVLKTAASGVPRFDSDPTTSESLGLLIEESRTNSIRNNTMVGAVAGTPGTLPTNWSAVTSGMAFNVIGTGTENGITYIDIQCVGTTTGGSSAVRFEPTNQVAAASGQSWTGSFYARQVAGATTNITTIQTNMFGRTSANAGNSDDSSSANLVSTISAASLSVARRAHTITLANATTAFVSVQLLLTHSVGVAIDITLRIGLPQLEQGAFATSVIPTTTTALTRAADVASINTLSPWFNATAGTLFAEVVSAPVNTIAQQAWYLSDGTSNNSMFLRRNTSGFPSVAVVVSGVTQGDISSGSAIAGNATYKTAFAYTTNDLAISTNASAVGTDTTASIPTVDRLVLGTSVVSTQSLNGYLRRITYYPRRLSNAQLQALTS